MKKILQLAVLILACSVSLHAQQKQSLTASATSCTSTGTTCLIYGIDQTMGAAVFTVGSNSGGNTLQFEASGDNAATWVALNVTPSNSTTAVTSTTGTGTWQANVAGYTQVRIRCSTFVSGSAVVSILTSIASARSSGGGTTIVNGAGSNPLGASLNIKAFPYSAVGDGIFLVDGVTNAGNNQLTSATATFRAGIVGYVITCYKLPQQIGAAAWAAGQTTVATFVNSSTITYTGTNAGVLTGLYCTITNTADTAAGAGIAQAFSDAKTTFNGATATVSYQNPPSKVYIPKGLFGFAATLNNLITTGNEGCVGIEGDAPGESVLIPTFTFTNTAIGNGGWAIQDRCSGVYLRNFTIEQASNPITFGSASEAIAVWGSPAFVQNVQVFDSCYTSGGPIYGIAVPAGSDIVIEHPKVVTQGSCGGNTGGLSWSGSEGDIYSPFLSNTNQNFACVNSVAGNNGAGIRTWGGVIDEGSVSSWTNCVDFWSIGTTWTGGANCVSIDATSIVWFFGGYCGTFATNTGSGPTVASGGQMYATGMHIRGQNAANYCWNAVAAGGIFDEGGNSCTLAGGATTYKAGSFPLVFPLQINATTQLGGRQTVSGTAPSGCSITGNGTSTCALATGSTDAAGTITITAAGTTTAVGLVSITYNQTTGTNQTTCNANYSNNGQTGTWATGAIPAIFVTNTTSAMSFNINNAGTNLTATSTYGVNYQCYGQ